MFYRRIDLSKPKKSPVAAYMLSDTPNFMKSLVAHKDEQVFDFFGFSFKLVCVNYKKKANDGAIYFNLNKFCLK